MYRGMDQMPQTPAAERHSYAARTRIAGAFLALSGVVSGLSGCNEAVPLQPPEPTNLQLALEAMPDACPPPPDTPQEWAAMMVEDSQWVTGDAVISQVLPDNRVVVFTSDSIGVQDNSKQRFNRNAMLVVCGDKAISVAPGGEAIPSNEKGEWYWPAQSVIENGKMYVAVNRMAHAEGAFPFKQVGVDLAVFSLPESTHEVPAFEYFAKTPSSDVPESNTDQTHNIQWPSSMYKADGYTYMHGGKHVFLSRNAYVARVPDGQLESLAAWEYWDGKRWGASEADAHPVIDVMRPAVIDGKLVGEPGQDATWTSFTFKQGKRTKHAMVGKRDGVFGAEIGMWTADKAEGPFTYKTLAGEPYVRPDRDADCYHNYLAYAQPGIRLESGEMLFTVSNNIKGLSDISKMFTLPGDFNVDWMGVSRNPKQNTDPADAIAPRAQPQGDCRTVYAYTPPKKPAS